MYFNFFPSFSFLLGTCLNENNDKRSRTKKLERMPFIRLSIEHVRTFQQWKYDTETFKFCSTFLFLKLLMVKVLNFKARLHSKSIHACLRHEHLRDNYEMVKIH